MMDWALASKEAGQRPEPASPSPLAGDEVLVPITRSLFVPGVLKASSKVLVDVGTGMYVGKDAKDAAVILEKREKGIEIMTEGVAKQIRSKEDTIRGIQHVLTEKVKAYGDGPGKAAAASASE